MTIHIGRNTLACSGLVGLGAAALAFTAGAPLTTILWFGLVLACPLMMLFMHGSHQQGGEPMAPQETLENKKYPPGV